MANDDRPTQSAQVFHVGWLESALRWLIGAQPTTAHLVHNLTLNVLPTYVF